MMPELTFPAAWDASKSALSFCVIIARVKACHVVFSLVIRFHGFAECSFMADSLEYSLKLNKPSAFTGPTGTPANKTVDCRQVSSLGECVKKAANSAFKTTLALVASGALTALISISCGTYTYISSVSLLSSISSRSIGACLRGFKGLRGKPDLLYPFLHLPCNLPLYIVLSSRFLVRPRDSCLAI